MLLVNNLIIFSAFPLIDRPPFQGVPCEDCIWTSAEVGFYLCVFARVCVGAVAELQWLRPRSGTQRRPVVCHTGP